jgi:hypothetical protein
MEYTKNMGVRVVRLMTEPNNVAALAAVQKMGFKPVADFLEMELENPPMMDMSRHSCWANLTLSTLKPGDSCTQPLQRLGTHMCRRSSLQELSARAVPPAR